jgi:integral membrane protein
MSAYILWRLVKFVGIAVFGAGVLAGWVRAPSDRARVGFIASTAGWLLTWTAGWGMVKVGPGASMADPWVSAGMLFSLVAFVAAVGAAGAARPRGWTGVAVAGFVASIAVMTLKGSPLAHPVALGLGVVAGVPAALLAAESEAPDVAWTERWFAFLAWGEGLSLLALFGLYMPAKYVLDVHLDAHQGWFGWAHGMLVMGYTAALLLTAWRAGWTPLNVVIGFVASFFPFGTFWFERRLERR